MKNSTRCCGHNIVWLKKRRQSYVNNLTAETFANDLLALCQGNKLSVVLGFSSLHLTALTLQ